MNADLTLRSLAVNGGRVLGTERPLWVGASRATDKPNGQPLRMSISLDKEWLWVRFSGIPSGKYRRLLADSGFVFGKKRMGWHARLSYLACSKVRELGAHTVHYHELASYMPPKEAKSMREKRDLDKPVDRPVDRPVDKALADALANKAKKEAAEAKARAEKANAKAYKKTSTVDDTMSQSMLELIEYLLHFQQEVNKRWAPPPQKATQQPKIDGIPEPWLISPSTWRKHHSKKKKTYTKYPNRRPRR